MLQIIFQLINFNTELLLLVDLKVDSFILQFEVIMVLSVILLEERFLLL